MTSSFLSSVIAKWMYEPFWHRQYFIAEKRSSIGLKSGEYGSKNL
jgi:hypothetical protein